MTFSLARALVLLSFLVPAFTSASLAAESPSAVLSRSNRKAGLALVIGVERYRSTIPEAKHARNDAEVFADFANKTLGIPRSRIRVLLDDRASSLDISDMLDVWLKQNATADSSIWIFFSGHGSPSLEDGAPVLVPHDAAPEDVARRGLPIRVLLEKIAALPARERFVVLDTCFSGLGDQSVIPEGKRPLLAVQAVKALPDVVLMAATDSKGTSGAARNAAHGLFTFHLLNGLRGSADSDADGKVSVAELARYVRARVTAESRELNALQVPRFDIGSHGEVAVVEEPVETTSGQAYRAPASPAADPRPSAAPHLPPPSSGERANATPSDPIGRGSGPPDTPAAPIAPAPRYTLSARGGFPMVVGVSAYWNAIDVFAVGVLGAVPTSGFPWGFGATVKWTPVGSLRNGLYLALVGELPLNNHLHYLFSTAALGYQHIFPSGFTVGVHAGVGFAFGISTAQQVLPGGALELGWSFGG